MSRLDFEKPVLELEAKIAELSKVDGNARINISDEIIRMQNKAQRLLKTTYAKLTPVQKVQVARHENRPHFLDYAQNCFESFVPLAGDRLFGEDYALIGGLARFQGQSCILMGQEKGNDTHSRIKHNFGMAKPEGYRKAQRLMDMASQFKIPVITLVDTAGAYPGLDAEERGQSEAIASTIQKCLRLDVPIVSVVIGEGGSGGAVAIATANEIHMLEHSIYSVISPEGCASILWRSASHADQASAALKLTAQDMLSLGLIDSIIEEPTGGAHRDHETTFKNVIGSVEMSLKKLNKLSGTDIIKQRSDKFLAMTRLK
jgi:acetyl-CoA carboxylase carboxyl transferase subunit alpha